MLQKSVKRVYDVEVVCIVVEYNIKVIFPIILRKNFRFSHLLLLWRYISLFLSCESFFFMV